MLWLVLSALAFGFVIGRWWALPLALAGWLLYIHVTPHVPLEPGLEEYLATITSAFVVASCAAGVLMRFGARRARGFRLDGLTRRPSQDGGGCANGHPRAVRLRIAGLVDGISLGLAIAAWSLGGFVVSLDACGRENVATPGACAAFRAPKAWFLIGLEIGAPAIATLFAALAGRKRWRNGLASLAVVGWTACPLALLWAAGYFG